MKKMQDKGKISNIYDKVSTLPQTKSYGWQTSSSELKMAATKTQGFSMTKDNTPPKTKANHKFPLKPMQIKSSAKLNKKHRLPLK
jgi:hypothetical protein